MANFALRSPAPLVGLTLDAVDSPDLDPNKPSGEGAVASTGKNEDRLWEAWDTPPRVPSIPVLHLEGFDGPMDLLLNLAERQRVDFGRMSILTLAEQFSAALQLLGNRVSIERKADWLVLATRLVLLRSRLMFPENAAAAEAAQQEAEAALRQLGEMASLRAAVTWLEAQPALGQDVFARGQPELLGLQHETSHEIDVVAFLWASLALFDDGHDNPDTAAFYRPLWLDLHTLSEARETILRQLADHPEGQCLAELLPENAQATDNVNQAPLRRRSAWTSAFAASLEMAKQGEVGLAQEGSFAAIHVRLGPQECPPATATTNPAEA